MQQILIVRTIGAMSAFVTMAGGTALAQAPTATETNPYWPSMMWWGGGWDGTFVGPLFMLLVMIAVVVTVVLLSRGSGGSGRGTTPGRSPLDILKERFARGEIDKAEYDERRRALGE